MYTTAGPYARDEEAPGKHPGREMSQCKVCGSDIYKVHDGSPDKYAWQHDITAGAGVPHQAYPVDTPSAADESAEGIDVEAASRPAYANPEDHPVYKHLGLSVDNIMDHMRSASDEQVQDGLNWYKDGHHLAKAIAHGDAHKGAGVLSAYSPQMGWDANINHAVHSLHTGHAVDKGAGVMGMHARAAQRIIDGEDPDQVLRQPKTNDFYHLLAHGDDTPGERQRVVIDRHAMSVAAGHRLTSDESKDSSAVLNTRHYYDHASGLYLKAADLLGKERKHKGIKPHQVQAITWGVRKATNDHEDEHHADVRIRASYKGRSTVQRNYREKNKAERGEHFPDLGGNMHTSQHLAYGDIKAPQDVDTLRESECPVCGNDDSWDGDRCQVCGFFRPPKMFMDPDTSVAGQVDLRQDNAEQNGLPDPSMDANGDQVGAAPGQTNSGGGLSLDPIDQSQITEDGLVGGQDPNDPNAQGGAIGIPGTNPMDQADPNGIAAADAQAAGNAALVPGDLDANGQPIPQVDSNGQPIDPGAANAHFQQGGEPFTPGPNAPNPEQPMDPASLDEDGNPIQDESNMLPGTDTGQDGQQPAMGDGEPGTPDDGVPDLICPACGFQADGAQPNSQGDSPMDPQVASPGGVEGDACPNCGQAALESISNVMV